MSDYTNINRHVGDMALSGTLHIANSKVGVGAAPSASGATVQITGSLSTTGAAEVTGNLTVDGAISCTPDYFMGVRNASLAITTSTITTCTYTSSTANNITESNGVITLAKVGIYQFAFSGSWQAHDTGGRLMYVEYDNVRYGAVQESYDDLAVNPAMSGSGYINVDDITKTITLKLWQTSGVDRNFTPQGGTQDAHFQIFYIGPA